MFDGRRKRKLRGPRNRALQLEMLESRIYLNSHPANELPHHIHPHLAIFIDGENFTIPACIGTNVSSMNGLTLCAQIGPTNENAHTHTNDGILHYNEETPEFRNLKEFFDTWGGVFNANEIKLPNPGGGFTDRTVDASHTIAFFVNGTPSSDFENYEPEDGDQIVISYESIPSDPDTPTLNPINNVTIPSTTAKAATARTIQIPLDGSDPLGASLTYVVNSTPNPSPFGAAIISSADPVTDNPSLALNVSGKDIDGNDVTGTLTFQLFKDLVPNIVDRIMELVNDGFYDNLTLHRVVNDFAVQGGDPNGDGSGGSGTLLDDEFTTQLTFTGFAQLAMANAGDDTNDSQFFVTDSNLNFVEDRSSPNEDPTYWLDFNYPIFGQLVSGFDTFNRIMLTPVHTNATTGELSTPDNTVRINSATIFNDDQHAVLRLSVPAGFRGQRTVTVTASNDLGLSVERSFQVTAIADPINHKAFLGPVDDLSTTANHRISVAIPATDLEADKLTFVVRDANNFNSAPANVTASVNARTHVLKLRPAKKFVGTIDLLVGVRDPIARARYSDGSLKPLNDKANFDTQRITLTVDAAVRASTELSHRKSARTDREVLSTRSALDPVLVQATSAPTESADSVATRLARLLNPRHRRRHFPT